MPINTRGETIRHCASHGEDFTGAYWTLANGNAICERCYDDNHFSCASCDEVFHHDDGNRNEDDEYLCNSCYESDRDFEEDSSNIRYREYRITDVFSSDETGKVLMSVRPFGVELESIVPSYEHKAKVSQLLPKEVGVSDDGSISGDGTGIEIQTPPASGIKAELLINDVCDILESNDATVNKSCGFHVHVDAKDVDDKDASGAFRAIQSLWLFYIAFEDVIMSFLPHSRRASEYCHSLRSDYHFREIMDAQNIEKLERIWYRVANTQQATSAKSQSKHPTRYRGINMHTLFSGRHIEIRFHSGTLNPRKILEWTNLHLRIMDMSLTRNWNLPYLKELSTIIDVNEKTQHFFDMLKLPRSSVDYFLSRQKAFAEKNTKPMPVSKDTSDRVFELLANEVES